MFQITAVHRWNTNAGPHNGPGRPEDKMEPRLSLCHCYNQSVANVGMAVNHLAPVSLWIYPGKWGEDGAEGPQQTQRPQEVIF